MSRRTTGPFPAALARPARLAWLAWLAWLALLLAAGALAQPTYLDAEGWRIQQKIEDAKLRYRKWVAGGGDPGNFRELIHDAYPLVAGGHHERAEEMVDEALAIVGADPRAAPPPPPPPPPPARVAIAVAPRSPAPPPPPAPAAAPPPPAPPPPPPPRPTRPVRPLVPRTLAIQGAYADVVVDGEYSKDGIDDPSLAYEPDGSVGYMAYTAIQGGGYFHDVRIAETLDQGGTWTYLTTGFRSVETTLGGRSGAWVYESPSLVHDPGDAKRPWKLFALKYFMEKDGRRPQLAYSWIAYRSARRPVGPWSKEVALLGAGGTGHAPRPPHHKVMTRLNRLHRDLARHRTYSEPGAAYLDGALWLTLSGRDRDGVERVVLLRSKDHARSWSYAGTLLDRAGAKALQIHTLDGTSLARAANRTFLLASPVRPRNAPDVQNDGCWVFEIEDLARARLKRDPDGVPEVHTRIPLMDQDSGKRGGGRAAFHPANTAGGVLFPQDDLDPGNPRAHVYSTGISLPR